MTAHKILISTAAVFFFFFGLWELRNYSDTGETWAVFRAALYCWLRGIRRLFQKSGSAIQIVASRPEAEMESIPFS